MQPLECKSCGEQLDCGRRLEGQAGFHCNECWLELSQGVIAAPDEELWEPTEDEDLDDDAEDDDPDEDGRIDNAIKAMEDTR